MSMTLGITQSVCNTCRRPAPAKVVAEDGGVYFETFCPEHGASRDLVRSDPEDYLRSLRYVKPAWVPREFAGRAEAACPEGCGFCSRHEQHLCMPIVEITSRCDLACPACLVDAGRPWDMTLAEFDRVLDGLLAAERQVDILNLSGGEPLVHPQALAFVDAALARPEIVRVSVSTNGLALLREPRLLRELARRQAVISLQFDGFSQRPYEVLRGRPLLDEKREVLARLAEAGVTTSLTMTAARGVNDDQFGPILDYFFAQPHVVSLMIQPLAFAGRGQGLAGKAGRLTIPDLRALLERAGLPRVQACDFAPLPCSHPLCFSLAYYLVLEGGAAASINRLVDASRWMDTLANRTIFGLDEEEHQRLKDLIYDLWSGPAASAPDSEAVMRTLRHLLDEMNCCGFDPRRAFSLTERRVKSIFVHAFQDAATFDLARVRRCCNAYPQPDGRLLPACVRNVCGQSVDSPQERTPS
jgi:uncharacterized radical SAM superfamily Fe-S cluster-containing enzyme